MKYFTFKSSDAQKVIDESGNREYPFQRLPDKYKKNVRKEVWSLSQNSAGLSIRFKTNSKKVIFKWSVKNDFKMNHMTDAGIKGLDIYEYVDNIWLYHSTGLPNASKNEHSIKFKNTNNKTLCLYLPLYDTITDLKIGIDDFSSLTFMKNKNRFVFTK